jgi:hypothetical protein
MQGRGLNAESEQLPYGERRDAKRFEIHTELRFRGLHESRWHEAASLNISENGMLFRTDCPVPEQSTVELKFALSMRVDRPGIPVTGRGVILRQVREANAVVALAASIRKYHFCALDRTRRNAERANRRPARFHVPN